MVNNNNNPLHCFGSGFFSLFKMNDIREEKKIPNFILLSRIQSTPHLCAGSRIRISIYSKLVRIGKCVSKKNTNIGSDSSSLQFLLVGFGKLCGSGSEAKDIIMLSIFTAMDSVLSNTLCPGSSDPT